MTPLKQAMSSSSESTNAKYDGHAKRILRDYELIAFLMKNLIPEFKDFEKEDLIKTLNETDFQVRTVESSENNAHPNMIVGKPTESTLPGEGTINFDVVFCAQDNKSKPEKFYFDIEPQGSYYPGYDIVARAIIYACRLISQQMGIEYSPKNYDGVKKVYSIWICFNAPDHNKKREKVANTIRRYSITKTVDFPHEEKVADGRFDLFNVIFITLGDIPDERSDILKVLTTIFSTSMSVPEKKLVLSEHGFNMSENMEKEELDMIGIVERIREEERLKYEEERLMHEKECLKYEEERLMHEKECLKYKEDLQKSEEKLEKSEKENQKLKEIIKALKSDLD